MSVGHETRKEMWKCLIMWELEVTCRTVWVSNVLSQWWSTNHRLACTGKSRASRSREVIAPLCLAAMKPHLCPLSKHLCPLSKHLCPLTKNWFGFWVLENKLVTNQSRGSRVWQKASKVYMKVLRQQGLFSLQEGRGKENLNAVLHLKEKEERARVFSEVHCKRLKLRQWQVAARKISIWN